MKGRQSWEGILIKRLSIAVSLMMVALPAVADAKPVCTVIADDDSGTLLLEDGDCRTRVTPASTFKVALAVIGFDAGFLVDADQPSLPFRDGYPDWGGAPWKMPTDPAHWMKHSVVWYSQEIARALGTDHLERSAASLGYGNADFAGDPGMDNGLERAWISSSLQISPLEQIAFLQKLVNRRLPVDPGVYAKVDAIVEATILADGWRVHGKTGTAYPRRADRSFDRARAYGWFVGWAVRGDETLVFARLSQDETQESGPAGIRARDAFLSAWPSLAANR